MQLTQFPLGQGSATCSPRLPPVWPANQFRFAKFLVLAMYVLLFDHNLNLMQVQDIMKTKT